MMRLSQASLLIWRSSITYMRVEETAQGTKMHVWERVRSIVNLCVHSFSSLFNTHTHTHTHTIIHSFHLQREPDTGAALSAAAAALGDAFTQISLAALVSAR